MSTRLLCLALLVACPGWLPAQSAPGPSGRGLFVGAGLSVVHFGDGSTPHTGQFSEVTFSPGSPSLYGLALAWGGRGLRAGLEARYSRAALVGRGISLGGSVGDRIDLVDHDVIALYSVAPHVSMHLATLRGGAVLRPGLGVILERWEVTAEEGQTRVGVEGRLALELPLFGSWYGAAVGTIGVTPTSPFTAAMLDGQGEPRALWRRGITATLAYRF